MTKPEIQERASEYSALIIEKLKELFNEGSIEESNFQDDDEFMAFLHAVSNVVPCRIMSHYTKNDMNILEFNHAANHMCFMLGNVEQP